MAWWSAQVAAAATATRCLAVFATALSSGACAGDGPRQRCTCASAAICLALAAIDDETTPTTPTKNTTTSPSNTHAISQWVAQVRTRPPSLSPPLLTSPLPVARARPSSHSGTRPVAFARPGWLFLFSVLMAAGLLFTMVFFVRPLSSSFQSLPHSIFVSFRTQIIMFSDLECDYINPIDLCNKLNQVRPPPAPLVTSRP